MMQKHLINIPSYSGRELSQIQLTNNNSSLAVFFPGQNYSCELPILYYLGKTAMNCNYDLLKLEYGYQVARTSFDPDDMEKIINESYNSIIKVADKYKNIVFVSKSLGTYIAGKTAELFSSKHEITHIFLTPIKSSISLINGSKGIVIVGTNDPVFGEQDMSQLKITNEMQLHKIERANHALEVDDLGDSLSIIKLLGDLGKQIFVSNS